MKLLLAFLAVASRTLAQDIASLSGSSDWIEFGNNKDPSTGEPTGEISPEGLDNEVLTEAESAADQNEIIEQMKKDQGIYDPNMYPYGTGNKDFKSPGADDAVSDIISLPSPFPYFGGSTTQLRASTNGLVALSDATILESNPSMFPVASISDPFVAAYWGDQWSKKHGRIYWRLESVNKTLLTEMTGDIVAGFPEMQGIDDMKYAFIFSYWLVTHFGAVKTDPDQKRNTFQLVLTTNGDYSFAIFNYNKLNWHTANGQTLAAVAGYDINDNYAMLPGSGTADVLNLNSKSTNSAMGGRHILRLDDNELPTEPPVTTDAPPPTATADPEDPFPVDTIVCDPTWPANDDTLGGAICRYKPSVPLGNGTCTIQFPFTVAWFHIFNAHIRADSPVTSTVWKFVAANDAFEPGEDGIYSFIVNYNDGQEFLSSQMSISCNPADEFKYAVYSFPQNNLQLDGRSNLRNKNGVFDPMESYSISFGAPVANFTVDDGRIDVTTNDNDIFTLTGIPDSLEEVWFSFQYLDFFGSNEVMAVGSADGDK